MEFSYGGYRVSVGEHDCNDSAGFQEVDEGGLPPVFAEEQSGDEEEEWSVDYVRRVGEASELSSGADSQGGFGSSGGREKDPDEEEGCDGEEVVDVPDANEV